MGKSVLWAADLVFLDLSFDGDHSSPLTHPCWDVLSEDHVHYGILLAASTVFDARWLLVMASTRGKSLEKVECL